MALENKLGITESAQLAREEERISKKKAAELFENGILDTLKPGSLSALKAIHKYLFDEIYDFAGKIRTVNIAKGNFRFAPVMYLEAAIENIEKMPQSTFDEIVDKYVEMNSLGGGTNLPLVWMSYGRLYRRNGAAISVYTGSDKPRANYIPAGCPIYKIDKDNHITKSSEAELVESSSNPSELYDGSRVIFNNRYQYVREMWILED